MPLALLALLALALPVAAPGIMHLEKHRALGLARGVVE
jgi:hypothetical protein